MEISNNKIFYFSIIVVAGILFSSCVKNQTVSDLKLFIKTYQAEDSSAIAFYVNQLQDGGFLLMTASGKSSLLLTRTDKYGIPQWQKKILKSGFIQYYLVSTPPWVFNSFPTGDDGHYFVQTGYYMYKFDTTGQIDYKAYNGSMNSKMILLGNSFISSACDGLISGTAPSTNSIYTYDENLNLKSSTSFPDSTLGNGKILDFFVSENSSSSNTYKILGSKYTRANFSTLDNAKLFAANISLSGAIHSQVVLDTNDHSHSDQAEWQTTTSDSNMILLGQRTDVTSSGELTYPVVVKFDKNLNTIWEREFKLNNNAISPRQINKCSDGGFIIVGSIRTAGYGGNYLPYALKIDKNGNKVWDKIITSTAGSGWFVYGAELSDGGYALVGESQQFGKGSTSFMTLFVRTDSNGNF